MTGLLGVPLGAPGSGRARYGIAMRMWADGALSPAQLEAYRVAAADDRRPPSEVLEDRRLPAPADGGPSAAGHILALIDEADRYLAGLRGPGLAEVRGQLSRWRAGAATMQPASAHPVVAAHLGPALAASGAKATALAGAISAAAPYLRWTVDGCLTDGFGAGFAQGHARCTLVGKDGFVAADGFDFGLLLVAPHVLCRDHAGPAAELCVPLTGPHGWRFGPGRPLVEKPAHTPVWIPSLHPQLTKAGAVPILCLSARLGEVNARADVVPADDWGELEARRLG